MKLKTVEVEGSTYAVVQNGNPVFVSDDGSENAIDVAAMKDKITSLNGEAMGHRKAKEDAEKALKAFEGIADPAAAIKALEMSKGLEDGKLIDAQKVADERQAAVDAAVASYTEKLTAETEARTKAEKALHKEMIGGRFARSQYISDKLAVPVQMVEATFGNHFAIEDGKVIARDAAGNPIYSDASPGSNADFDEALSKLVASSPFRDSILKGANQSGSGSTGSGSGGGGSKTIPRAEFEKLAPADAASKMADGYTLTD